MGSRSSTIKLRRSVTLKNLTQSRKQLLSGVGKHRRLLSRIQQKEIESHRQILVNFWIAVMMNPQMVSKAAVSVLRFVRCMLINCWLGARVVHGIVWCGAAPCNGGTRLGIITLHRIVVHGTHQELPVGNARIKKRLRFEFPKEKIEFCTVLNSTFLEMDSIFFLAISGWDFGPNLFETKKLFAVSGFSLWADADLLADSFSSPASTSRNERDSQT